jgi:hypothetical protein
MQVRMPAEQLCILSAMSRIDIASIITKDMMINRTLPPSDSRIVDTIAHTTVPPTTQTWLTISIEGYLLVAILVIEKICVCISVCRRW